MDHGGKAGVGFVGTHGDTSEIFQIAEEILDQMPPTIHHLINLQRFFALWSLGNTNQRTALIHLVDDPVGIKCLIRQKRIELQPPDQRFNPDCIVTVSG